MVPPDKEYAKKHAPAALVRDKNFVTPTAVIAFPSGAPHLSYMNLQQIPFHFSTNKTGIQAIFLRLFDGFSRGLSGILPIGQLQGSHIRSRWLRVSVTRFISASSGILPPYAISSKSDVAFAKSSEPGTPAALAASTRGVSDRRREESRSRITATVTAYA